MNHVLRIDRRRASLFWPFRCHYAGVIVKAEIELIAPLRGATNNWSQAQSSDGPHLTFSDSLLVASKAFAGPGTGNKGSTNLSRQEPTTSHDAKETITSPISTPGKGKVSAPEIVLTGASKPAASETRSVVPIKAFDLGQDSLSNDFLNEQSNARLSVLSSAVPDLVRKAVATAAPGGKQVSLPKIGSGSISKATPSTATAVPGAPQDVPANAALYGNQPLPMSVPNVGLRMATGTPANRVSNSVHGQVQSDAFSEVQGPRLKTIRSSVSSVTHSAAPDRISSAVQVSAPVTELADTNKPIPSSVLSGVSSVPAVTPFSASSATGQSAVRTEIPGLPSNEAPNVVQTAVPGAFASEEQLSSTKEILSSTPGKAQVALPKANETTLPIAVLGIPRAAVESATHSWQPTAPTRTQIAAPNQDSGSKPIAVSNRPTSAAPSAVHGLTPSVASRGPQFAMPAHVSSTMPTTGSNTPTVAAANAIKIPAPGAVLDEAENTIPKEDGGTTVIVNSTTSNAAAPSSVQSPAQGTASFRAQSPVSNSTSVPSSVQSPAQGTASFRAQSPVSNSTSVPSSVQSPAQSTASLGAQSPVSNVFQNVPSDVMLSAVPIEETTEGPVGAQNPLPGAALNSSSILGSTNPSNVVSTGSKIAGTRTVTNGASGSLPRTFLYNQFEAVRSVPVNGDPIQHAAMNTSRRESVISQSTTAPRDASIGPPAAPVQGAPLAGHSAPGSITDEFAALTQLNSRLNASPQEFVSNVSSVPTENPSPIAAVSGKDGSKVAVSDSTGAIQHAQPGSDRAGSQTGSQEAPDSGVQAQSSDSTQGQKTAPLQTNSPNQTVAVLDSAQNMLIGAPPLAGSLPAATHGHAAVTPANTSSTPAPVQQTIPVINTAKLVQTMGQSEMRVGMKSAEFGNISISTSANREQISAQILVDHSELAKVLTSHVPDMQARFGSNQAVDVRIDMNGQQSTHGSSAFGDSSNGSADGSRGGRQQGGNAAPHYSGTEGNGQQFSPASAATAVDGGSNSRLDIRA